VTMRLGDDEVVVSGASAQQTAALIKMWVERNGQS
jgi:hypothetical protein